MTKRLSESLYAWRMGRLKETADRYAELPANFRLLLAKAARLPEDRREVRLDELTEAQRAALKDACRRLKGYCETAWPLLIQTTQPSLPA